MSLQELLKKIEYEGSDKRHSLPTLTKETIAVAPDFFEDGEL